jgi:tetratricopeptide (TPR) repeat protein
MMEMLMRLAPIALCVGIALATVASAGQGQETARKVDGRSLELAQQAGALASSSRFNEAIDLYETALVVDPGNRLAYLGLARVAQAQQLPGKAIRLYGEVLKLNANDVDAVAGQGEALVQRGALDRAKRNLEKLRSLCRTPCPQAESLAATISRGPPQVAASQSPTPAPVRN